MPHVNVKDTPTGWLDAAAGLGKPLKELMNAVYSESHLSLRERELARMRIAMTNECLVCQNTRVAEGLDAAFYDRVLEWESFSDYSERERLAAEFAERFALRHVEMSEDQDFWTRLKAQFTEEEILELTISCVMWLGTGRALKALDIAQSCSITLPGNAD